MKRNLLLISFLIFAHLSFGQVKIYPKVGIVVSSQDLEGYAKTDSKIKNRVGFLAGGGLEGGIYQRLKWNSDLHFVQLGHIQEFKTSYEHRINSRKLNYIIAPVALKYDVISSSQKVFLTMGAYGGMFLGGKDFESYKGPDSSWDSESSFYTNDRSRYDRFDWGVQIGSGYNFIIGKNEFVADARYSIGMSDVTEAKTWHWARGTSQDGYNTRNRFFSLSLGYVLPSKKRKPDEM